MGSRSPKSNQFFSMSQQYNCKVCSNPFIHSGDRVHTNHFPTNLSLLVTLKMETRSPKSNQFFYMSQHCRCANLVKILSFLQEIGCGQAVFQQSKASCDLENGFKVTKIYSVLLHVPAILMWVQGHQNLFSSFTCPSNIDVQVWLKSIHFFKI